MQNKKVRRNSKELRESQLVLNKEYFSNYKKNYSKAKSSYEQYETTILGFLEYMDKNDRDIKQIEFGEIETYIDVNKLTVNSVLRAALIDFFKETGKTAKIAIDINSLKLLKDKTEPEREAKSLSIQEVIEIRNKLYAGKHYSLLFTFEMIYTHGFTWPEFEQFGGENYSRSYNIFTFLSDRKTKEVKLCKTIRELIDKAPEILEKKGNGAYLTDMREISKIVDFHDRDKVIWRDVDKTRKDYFPTCPKCEEKYPNSAEFWSLVEFQEDNDGRNWLYCRNCAAAMEKMVGDQ